MGFPYLKAQFTPLVLELVLWITSRRSMDHLAMQVGRDQVPQCHREQSTLHSLIPIIVNTRDQESPIIWARFHTKSHFTLAAATLHIPGKGMVQEVGTGACTHLRL